MGICPCTRDTDKKLLSHTEPLSTTLAASRASFSTPLQTSMRLSLRAEGAIMRLPGPFSKLYRHLDQISVESGVELTFAEYRATHQRCYVKIIPKTLKETHGKRLGVLPQLDHPHVLKTFEVCQDDQFRYVVAEAYEGGDISEYYAIGRPLGQKLAATVGRAVLSALAYCHARGVVHKTLSFEHLFVQEKRLDGTVNVKLAGFENYGLIPIGKESRRRLFESPEERDGREANAKSDVWSCGALLYILLCGNSPFAPPDSNPFTSAFPRPCVSAPTSPNISRLNSPRSTLAGDVNKSILTLPTAEGDLFTEAAWVDVSKSAAALVRRMLSRRPNARPSALKCLEHPWIRRFSDLLPANSPLIAAALTVLRDKPHPSSIRAVIMTFIVTRVIKAAVINPLAQVFEAIDRDCDGLVSRLDLLTAASESRVRSDAERIASKAPFKFTEFLLAAIPDDVILSQENLLAAFNALDKDASGQISILELKNFFRIEKNSGNTDEWKEFISAVDISGDGEIDFREFNSLMKRSK